VVLVAAQVFCLLITDIKSQVEALDLLPVLMTVCLDNVIVEIGSDVLVSFHLLKTIYLPLDLSNLLEEGMEDELREFVHLGMNVIGVCCTSTPALHGFRDDPAGRRVVSPWYVLGLVRSGVGQVRRINGELIVIAATLILFRFDR